jgi:hypothetical protein
MIRKPCGKVEDTQKSDPKMHATLNELTKQITLAVKA